MEKYNKFVVTLDSRVINWNILINSKQYEKYIKVQLLVIPIQCNSQNSFSKRAIVV